MLAPLAAGHDRLIWFVATGFAERFCGVDGGCGFELAATAKFQFAPPLLSQVPEPLLKTQFRLVAFAGMTAVYCHQFEAELKLIAASGETTGFQLFQPRRMYTGF